MTDLLQLSVFLLLAMVAVSARTAYDHEDDSYALRALFHHQLSNLNAYGAALTRSGVMSGNVVQVPVHVPSNVCGNTISVVGLLNPTFGNTCIHQRSLRLLLAKKRRMRRSVRSQWLSLLSSIHLLVSNFLHWYQLIAECDWQCCVILDRKCFYSSESESWRSPCVRNEWNVVRPLKCLLFSDLLPNSGDYNMSVSEADRLFPYHWCNITGGP